MNNKQPFQQWWKIALIAVALIAAFVWMGLNP